MSEDAAIGCAGGERGKKLSIYIYIGMAICMRVHASETRAGYTRGGRILQPCKHGVFDPEREIEAFPR